MVNSKKRKQADSDEEDVRSHKQQLKGLKDQDPEFYEYLKQADEELLGFGAEEGDEEAGESSAEEDASEDEDEGMAGDEGLAGGESDEEQAISADEDESGQDLEPGPGSGEEDISEPGSEEEQEESASGGSESEEDDGDDGVEAAGAAVAQQPAKRARELQRAQVDALCERAKSQASMGAVRQLLQAYRSACSSGEDDEDAAPQSVQFLNPGAADKVLMFVLQEANSIFERMLGLDKREDYSHDDVIRARRWKTVKPLVKSYFGSSLNIVGDLKDARLLSFVLRRLRAGVRLLAASRKLQRRCLQRTLAAFAGDAEEPRGQAILLIRQLGLQLPQPMLDDCLKGVYRRFVQNAKFVHRGSIPQINFMATCVVEMYALDPAASYRHMFGALREVAQLLRAAGGSPEQFREMLSWQTVSCLELFGRALTAHCGDEGMRALVYPVTQLLRGACRLAASPRYFPLRLRFVRSMLSISRAAKLHVPVAALLLDVVGWVVGNKPGRGGGEDKAELVLRVGKAGLQSAAFHDTMLRQALDLLSEYATLWSEHAAFPELALPTLLQLQKLAKAAPAEKLRSQIRQVAVSLQAASRAAAEARERSQTSVQAAAAAGGGVRCGEGMVEVEAS